MTDKKRGDNDEDELMMLNKSATMHDTDVVKSTVTKLFKILSYALRNEEISGVPFHIDPRHNKIQEYTSSTKRNTNTIGKRGYIVINPKEFTGRRGKE